MATLVVQASFPTITVLHFRWFLFSVAIVTAHPQNLTALSNADPTTCRLVASFRAQDLSFSDEFPRLRVEKRRLSYHCNIENCWNMEAICMYIVHRYYKEYRTLVSRKEQ